MDIPVCDSDYDQSINCYLPSTTFDAQYPSTVTTAIHQC